MKKNLILGGIFVLLLILTYFFQEKKNEAEYFESLTKDHLIVSGINKLKLPHVNAEKRDGVWWQGEQRLSYNSFNIIEKKITEIKKIKDVTGDKKTYFSEPFIIEVNGETWTFGDMSLDRQGFYLSRGDKIMLVEIEGESTELTQDENEVASKKYQELKGQVSKSLDELIEKQLFRFYPELRLNRIFIEAFERLPYELDLEKNTTLPAPIPGIKVHNKIREKLGSLLTQVMIKEEIPYSENLKVKQMGTLKFISDKTVTWELWLRDEKTADAILIDPDLKKSYLMIGGTLKIYFTMVQDYWDKKIIPPAEFKNFDRLPVIISQGNKSADFEILNREPLEFTSAKYRLNSENLMTMINILFNLNNYDQADRVSLLSKSERKMLMNQEDMHVMIMGQELILWMKPQELIVVNLTQGFKAHFLMPYEKLGLGFKDMVK